MGGAHWRNVTVRQRDVDFSFFLRTFNVTGQVAWNKFLGVITREPADATPETWQGPIIMRGMSRSGRMHTMAGHGPFEAEPCAKYGYK